MKGCLLFHRGTPWCGTIRGSTNIFAEHFLETGYHVIWLGALAHLGQRGSSRRTSATLHHPRLLEIAPYAPTPWLKHKAAPGWLRLLTTKVAYRAAIPSIAAAVARHGFPLPQVIWTAGGDAGSLREGFRGSKAIVQCVDLYEAYAGSNIIPVETADYSAADCVVAIGESLARFLLAHRGVKPERLQVIGQGADLRMFSGPTFEPESIKRAPRPRLVYLGVLDKADPSLMTAALTALPRDTGSLILIGPSSQWAERLARSDPRVVLCGPMHAQQAANSLRHCDVGLMLYDQARPPLQYVGQNPLKLYEMAAAGLAIVSTPHDEYQWTRPPVLIVRDYESTVSGVRVAIQRRKDLSESSLAFAAANSWQNRFCEAEHLVHRLLLDCRPSLARCS